MLSIHQLTVTSGHRPDFRPTAGASQANLHRSTVQSRQQCLQAVEGNGLRVGAI